ncbi:MAG TPA: glycosyltransferase [Anaerolineaceae bacterium]|nr:glycosyltransferase [Anaerolineaceae bacterium]
MSEIAISIVIPTYQRDALLDRCLTALVHQDFDPSQYEIIVVDDAASESTRALVNDWSERTSAYPLVTDLTSLSPLNRDHPSLARLTVARTQIAIAPLTSLPSIRYLAVHGPKHGPAVARNIGWEAARGPLIAFTDDDCIPQQNWLRSGMDSLLAGADGASGRTIVPQSTRPSDYEWNARGLEKSIFITANCFYRRPALQAAGGFDERFQAAWREDTDLYFTLLEGGFNLVRCADAVVIHPVRPARWGISLSQQKKNIYNALLYRKHPRFYRTKIQKMPPIHYYAAVGCMLLAVAAAISRTAPLFWGSLAIWSGLTVVFCLRRLKHTAHTPGHILEMALTSLLIPPVAVYWRLRGAIRYRTLFL